MMTVESARDLFRERVILKFDGGRLTRDLALQEALDNLRFRASKIFVEFVVDLEERSVKNIPSLCISGMIRDIEAQLTEQYSKLGIFV
jgi:hypothetical protein